jgi:hypothetical protein
MPTGRSGRQVQANQIVVVVTSAASDSVQTLPVWSTMNLHRVSMAVVTLPRKISIGVTIHATRVVKYGHNSFESSSGTGIVARHRVSSRLGMPRRLNRNPQG